jgi:cytochrome c biogenesis protein CcdA/thiol-disulfide isomerase/thioredoxin
MILFIVSYLGGVLTILSPCILPVLPFVFARTNQPFIKSGLPLLFGMALTFAVVASLAAVSGGWVVAANQYGRVAALVLLAVFGVTLLLPELSDRLTRPLVALGGRLSQSADQAAGTGGSTVLASLLLGVATGLLWAPCAGPVLGLILTGAALQGANAKTTVLLLAYAAGAATSLALALLVGGRVFTAMKRSLGAGEWIRRGLGAAVLVAIAAIAFGLDTSFLTNVSLASTTSLEQKLLDKLHSAASTADDQKQSAEIAPGKSPMMSGKMMRKPADPVAPLPVEGVLPSLSGAVEWLNSPPLTAQGLKGKVVLVDFWTYSCINCLSAIPYVRAWAEKYKSQGLVVIGVHAPEFAFERSIDNVKSAISTLKITYPVAIDNEYMVWRAFENEYWPAHYFIDSEGRIRHHHFGEGEYDESERVIQQLLAEAGRSNVPIGIVAVKAFGAEAASDKDDVDSPETYIGYNRLDHFVSPGGVAQDASHAYMAGSPQLNEWALAGNWTIGGERAALNEGGGGIVYRFHARDLHLVLGPAPDGKPVRFRVTIDSGAPGAAHGVDVDADGQGVVTAQRLYQLIREPGAVADRTFEIRFLDPGVQAYAFTFG